MRHCHSDNSVNNNQFCPLPFIPEDLQNVGALQCEPEMPLAMAPLSAASSLSLNAITLVSQPEMTVFVGEDPSRANALTRSTVDASLLGIDPFQSLPTRDIPIASSLFSIPKSPVAQFNQSSFINVNSYDANDQLQ
jgi:hypothetical protein